MKVAGVRVRGAAVLYMLVEDLLIVGILCGAFAFAHLGQLAPLGVASVAAMLLAIKVAFFWTGM